MKLVRKTMLISLALMAFFSIAANRSQVVAQSQQDVTSKQNLYERFQNNYRTNHSIAYEAAKEYLRQYPNDASENAQFMRRWITAFENVTSGSVQPPANETSIVADKIPADKHYEKAEIHLKLQEWAYAENEFRQAVILDPENSTYRFSLADILEKQKKWKDASDQYLYFVKISPVEPSYRKMLAKALFNQGAWGDAEIHYRKYFLLTTKPASDDYLNFASSLDKLGKWQEAEDAYLRAASINDGRTRKGSILMAIATHYLKEGQKDVARLAFAESLGYSCSDAASKECKEAISTVTQMLGKGENSLSNTYWSGRFYMPTSYDSNENRSVSLLELSSDNTAKVANRVYYRDEDVRFHSTRYWEWQINWFQVENVLIISGIGDRATAYIGIIKDNKISPPDHKDYRFGNPERVIDLESYINSNNIDIALILLNLKQFDKAETWIKKNGDPTKISYFVILGVALANQGKWKESEQALKSAKSFISAPVLRKNLSSAIEGVRKGIVPSEYLDDYGVSR